MSTVNEEELDKSLSEAKSLSKRVIVDALVYNEKGEIFAQRRSPHRLKHPNCWDLPGGHLDGDESLLECLKREIKEELSVEVEEVITLLYVQDFELHASMLKEGEAASERIFQFLVRLKDLDSISLEKDKAVEYQWFSRKNVDKTVENRSGFTNKVYVRNSIVRAFDYLEKAK